MKNISETKATENCTQSFISGVMNVSEYTVYCARYFIQNIVFSFYVVPVLHINTFHYVNSVMLPLNQADKSLCKE